MGALPNIWNVSFSTISSVCSMVFYSVVKSIIISLSSSIFNVVWISQILGRVPMDLTE
jgi:hypothetical protein